MISPDINPIPLFPLPLIKGKGKVISLEGYAPLKLPVYYSQSNQAGFRVWVLPLIKDLRRNGSLNLNTVRIYLQERYSKLIEETMLGYGEEQLTLVGAEA